MKEPELKITQRMLPHWEYDGSIYFITFNTWQRLQLSSPAQQVVLDVCLFFNTQRYELFALVVMPDHVHMLIQPLLSKPKKNTGRSEALCTASKATALNKSSK